MILDLGCIPKVSKDPEAREKEKKDLTSKHWTIHFDGVRCRTGSGEGICLTSPFGE